MKHSQVQLSPRRASVTSNQPSPSSASSSARKKTKKTKKIKRTSSASSVKYKKIDKTIEDFKIQYSPVTQVATLTLDIRGSKVNILKSTVLVQLSRHLNVLAKLPIAVLMIQSAKRGSFIAGADIREITKILKEPGNTKIIEQGQNVIDQLAHFKAPTVAVIDGHALGGGLELALACRYRVVSGEAYTKLALPEVTLGIVPGFGGTQRLPALIGLPLALKMMLTGTAVSAQKAYKIGLADKIIPSAYLPFELPKWIEQVRNEPQTLLKARQKRIRRHFSWLASALIKLSLNRILKFTRKQILKTTGPHYPAPIKLLDIIKQSYPAVSPEKIRHGLTLERAVFLELLQTPSTPYLLALFNYSTQLKNQALTKPAALIIRPQAKSTQSGKKTQRSVTYLSGSSSAYLKRTLKKPHFPIKQGWVIGSGAMGTGIAWLMSHSGLPVRIKETSWTMAQQGYQKLLAIHSQREQKVRQAPKTTLTELHRTAFTTTWTPINNETLVVEAVPEEFELKKQIFKEIEATSQQDTIIATNTSSLPIDTLAASLKHSERFLAIHFFNPVHRMKLVELAPAPQTDPELFKAVGTFFKKQGKIVIPVKACPGFLVNRILFAYLSEAMQILEETKDLVTIDESLKDFGMPMGPFRLIDQVGIDVCTHVAKCLAETYSHLPNVLHTYTTLSKRKWLGQKTGIGFYVYANRQPMGVNPELYHELYGESVVMKRTFTREEIVERLLMALAHEALIALELGIVQTPWELDLALLYGTGFPAFRGGILRYIDELTPGKALKRFERLKDFYGNHFAPPTILKDLARQNRRFYND